MKAKLFWHRCPLFVLDEDDAVFLEVSPAELEAKILPYLNPAERLKFDQLKEVYVAKASSGMVTEGCYYFLVSKSVHAIKFESVALFTSDLASRGGEVWALPDLPLDSVEAIDSLDAVNKP